MINFSRCSHGTIQVASDHLGTAELCDLEGYMTIESLQKPVYYFNRIKVKREDEGKGYGKELMIEVCKIADREGITILNELNPYGKRDMKNLKRFFRASGFEDFGNEHTMVRKPKTMNKLILTVGLPRSGKTTWALKQGYPVVNRDSIRLALHGTTYIQEAEDMVSTIEMYMVKSLFLAGHTTVIVDSTHLKQKYIDRWKSGYGTRYGNWNIQIQAFNTDVETCIERAKKDDRFDLIDVIKRMAEDL